MLGKILLATDFSECCSKAVEFIKKMKESVNEIVVLHVIDEKEIRTVATNIAWIGESLKDFEEDLRKKMRTKAEEDMDRLREQLEGFEVKTIVTEGYVAEKIIEVSESEDVALIVMGSHGKSNLKEILLGSVSESVIRRARKPVAIVRREYEL